MFGAGRSRVKAFRRALAGVLLAGAPLAATLLVAALGAAHAAPRSLKGTLVYRERIALPPDARAEVSLVDVARADAPATPIASTIVSPAGQVPIRYELVFDDSLLQPRGRYALQARIMSGDRLLFVTTERNSVLAGGADRTNLLLRSARAPAAQTAPDPARLQGRWLAEDIGGGGVVDRIQTNIEIEDDGRIAGSGGCNRIFGQAKIEGDRISFGAMGATQMACPPAVMNQERKFLDALAATRSWRIDEARRKLVLVGSDGKALATLARM